ncbi:hypothetical protein C3495_06750 [Clostridiaceae bacterium 14S0207]|nr:hypothetical protein C3495_06750 [Clostridiaceae bacterium 14S0207]
MKKYFRSSLLTLKDYKHFSTDFLYSLLAIPIQVFVIYLFWKYSLQNTKVLSYTSTSLCKYFVFINIIQLSCFPAMIVTYEVWNEINKGDISLWILKPISYPLYVFSKKFSEFLIKFLLATGLVEVITIFMGLSFNFKDFTLGTLLSLLGFILLFQIQFVIGLCTFWVGKVLTLRDNIMYLTFLLGGQLLPINMFPKIIQKVSLILPMQYIYYVPSRVLSNTYNMSEFSLYIKIELAWVVIFSVIIKLLWNKGLRRYSPQGG